MGRFLDNLTLLFIGLRLAEVIDWSWWLVLSPIVIAGICGFLVAFGAKFKQWNERREWRKLKAERRGQS